MTYRPLERPTTHQSIIHTIKQRLNLPHLQSSFISRQSILSYIRLLHTQTLQIQQSLNPKSLQPQIEAKQNQCARLRILLCEKENEENYLKLRLKKLEQDLLFTRQYNIKSMAQCQTVEKEITSIVQDHPADMQQEYEPVQMLMNKFMSYFQDPQAEILTRNKDTKNIKNMKETQKKPYKKSDDKIQKKSEKTKTKDKMTEQKQILKNVQQKLTEPDQQVIGNSTKQTGLHHPQLQMMTYTYTGQEDEQNHYNDNSDQDDILY